jgi:uncharacterized protein YeaO (DUF488 family)/DNA-binding MarR family transcriptional regulator
MAETRLSDADYTRLLNLRSGLRRFLHWSEEQAEAAGLTPAQHQLLLAIRGKEGEAGPTIGEVADALLLKHHSVVELVHRAEAAGLVRRRQDSEDRRVVHLELSRAGEEALERLSSLHLEELRRLADDFGPLWEGIEPVSRRGARSARRISVARVYDAPRGDGLRLLVDRLWPRGMSKQDAPFDRWLPDVAPSTALRRWYGHRPERFAEFERRYTAELRHSQAPDLGELQAACDRQPVVLLTATKDVEHSAAAVLAREMGDRRRARRPVGPRRGRS